MNAPCEGVHRLILRHVADRPGAPALVYPHGRGYRRLTYGVLGGRIAAAAAGLAARGVRRGDRVVVLVPMSADLYVVLLATVALGAVAVFVEPASKPGELARVIRLTRPRAFVGIPKAHALRLAVREVARVPVAVVVGPRRGALLGAVSLAELEAEHGGADLPAIAVAGDDPALLTFSSGSSGTPKGASRSHRFLAAQHAAIDRMLDRQDGGRDVDLSAFAIVLLSSLASGNVAVIPRLGRGGVADVDGAAIGRLLSAEGVSTISGSPAFLGPVFAAARGRGLPGVRRVISGGAPVPVELCERAGEVLPDGSFLVVYGSTEAEPIATIDAAEVRAATAARTRAGAGLCVGRPDPAIELRLVRPTGARLQVGPGGLEALAVAPGEVGEVAVCGAHVNRGYYRNRPAERAIKIADERGRIWHRTGDAAYLDAGGRLWLVGRIADVVERGGRTYHPAAVEAAAQSLALVARAALIAGPRGEALLVIEPRRVSALATRPGARVRAHMDGAGLPVDRVAFARRLPTDPRHRAKLDYAAIRRTHGGVR